jgi:hypothetical protein
MRSHRYVFFTSKIEGVSAQVHASIALPRVGHSVGVVTVEKKKPDSPCPARTPFSIQTEQFRLLLLIYNPHQWCLLFYSSGGLFLDESSNVNSVHGLHSVHTVNNEQDSSLKTVATDHMRLGTSVICNYLSNVEN